MQDLSFKLSDLLSLLGIFMVPSFFILLVEEYFSLQSFQNHKTLTYKAMKESVSSLIKCELAIIWSNTP